MGSLILILFIINCLIQVEILISNSENISKFPMFDDGDTNINGDETAEDGTYTVVLRFPESVETGDWEFRFNAVDKAGQVSNTIINSLKVN